MKLLKNPMTNAIYIASITAIYAMVFIVSSEFVSRYVHLLSESWWSLFIQNKNMKFIGLGMISGKRQILMRSDTKLPQPFASWSNSL